MSCSSPVLAYRYYSSDLGRSAISFKVHSDDNISKLESIYGVGNVFSFGCGKCEECRKQYSKDWAIRLTLEKSYWRHAYFITLTYDDDHVNYACHKDIIKFRKRLARRIGSFAYFGCRELGEITQRVHYHMIIFSNRELDEFGHKLINGKLHYKSKIILDSWLCGANIDVSTYSHYCGAYVSKYCTKDGSCFMSRNIAKRYFYDHYQKIIDDGFVLYGHFGDICKVDVPKFMSEWFRSVCDLSIEDFRKERSEFMRMIQNENMRGRKIINREELNLNKDKSYSKKRGDF